MYSNCLAARARKASSRASRSSSSSGSPSLSSPAPGSSAEESGLQPWPRVPQLIWRGRATGNLRGWSRHATHMPHAHANTLSTMLLNKRTHLALMSRPYPWMNVSITGLVASELWRDFALNASGHANLLKLDELLLGMAGAPNITMESWTSFDLVLSIDGFGPPWRLPKQMLGMTPIVKVESPLKEFFAGRIQPGIHYEPVSYDLADLPARSRHLIEEAHSGSTRLHQMARAARDVAIDSFHALAQLDTLAVSLLRIQAASPWQVTNPYQGSRRTLLTRWHKVYISRNHSWTSPMLAHAKDDIADYLHRNFLPIR
ncbi:hypothetical protein V8C86DRAFT_2885693 [Haematococcus lacustris]